MKSTRKMVLSGLFIAIGTISAGVLHIPIGPIKAFPIQHLINVLSAILLGPFYAVGNAFCISLLRNLMGTGTILAFPGSLFGALIAGVMYTKFKNSMSAFLGEVFGTGLIGASVGVLILNGSFANSHLFYLAFALSSAIGALIALAFYQMLLTTPILKGQSTRG